MIGRYKDNVGQCDVAQPSVVQPGELGAIEDSVARLLGHCGVGAGEVDCVFLTGGSSLVPAVRHLFERRFGKERLRAGAELTSVASGLALRALE
jgi:hypothetical chaperone protein